MPRLPRVNVSGAVYLVTSRAPVGQLIFKEGADYEMYLDLLAKYKKEHQFKLFAYCFLPDRLHLVVEPMQAAGISKIMHDLNSNYTKHSNTRHERRGPLFESRFKSILVDKANFLSALTRYVHRSAGGAMKEHVYSSYGAYTGGKTSPVSMGDEIAEVKEDLKKKGVEDYEGFCADTGAAQDLEKKLSRGGVLGSDEFVASVKNKIREHSEALKESATADIPAPKRWVRAIAVMLVLGSVVGMTYLYSAKSSLESKYQALLQAKELEFYEKTSFENRSPIALASLEGTEWRVEMVSSFDTSSYRDTLKFENGQLSSSYFGAMGFAPAKYERSSYVGGAEQWRAVHKNASGETLVWSGVWRGDALKGEVTVQTAAGLYKPYSFFSLSGKYIKEIK